MRVFSSVSTQFSFLGCFTSGESDGGAHLSQILGKLLAVVLQIVKRCDEFREIFLFEIRWRFDLFQEKESEFL